MKGLSVGCALVMTVGLIEIGRLSVALGLDKIVSSSLLTVSERVVARLSSPIDGCSYNFSILTPLLLQPLLAQQQTEVIIINSLVCESIWLVLN